jgi:predicted AAA+ superfamily ATPase
VIVAGLRQAGKSTFLQHERGLAGRRYASLDDFAHLAAARADPEAFVRTDEPLTIDEAQRCPELLTAIKREVDRRRRPGRFLLSGSANFALLRGITETLAGRALYLTLHPFARRELTGRPDAAPAIRRLFEEGAPPSKMLINASSRRLLKRAQMQGGARSEARGVLRATSQRRASAPTSQMGLFQQPAEGPHKPVTREDILSGGLPPVCLHLVRRADLWFKGYEQTYLERDVREFSRLTDLVPFRNLLRLAALRTGQVLTVSELARDAKLNAITTSRYLSVLEASFVVTRLAPYLANRASRLIKSPKLYFSDAGLAAHLAGITRADSARDDPLWGALLETYVAHNLAAILESAWPATHLAYWHVQGRHEVDFVVEVGRETLALEIKASTRWDDRDLTGLRAFLDKTPRCRLAILAYGGTESVRLGDRLWAVPLPLVLS